MAQGKVRKTEYSEAEAAGVLGISVGQLRSLILNHIVDQEEDLANVPKANFHPSDLLVLKLLAGSETQETDSTLVH